jgi:phage major head subunit gpT-like protein
MKEFKGEVTKDAFQLTAWEIENREFYDVKTVKATAIKDDQYGMYAPLMEIMGESGAAHPDVLLAELLLASFAQTDYTGSAFFASNKKHIPNNAKAGTFTNTFTKQLTATHFNTARAALVSLLGPTGIPCNRTLNLKLVTGPVWTKTALEILEATTISTGGTNVLQGMAQHVEVPMLGSSTAWFLINAGPMAPFLFQEREALSFVSMTSPTDPNVFAKHEFDYKAYSCFAVGFGMPQRAYGSTVADA